jgi:hypothetical protein
MEAAVSHYHAEGLQDYPVSHLKSIYGSRGNYVTVAQKFGNGRFGRRFVRHYRRVAQLPGIDFANHLNYWEFGFPAVLLISTAFYRNRSYHEASDTLARLNMRRLGLAVDALMATVLAGTYCAYVAAYLLN